MANTYAIVVKLINPNMDYGGQNMFINFNEIAERKITGGKGA